VLKKRPRQGLPHNKEEEAEKGRDRDQVGSLFVHKEASITRDQVGFHCVDEEPSRASNSGLTMWTKSRARASNHLSQGIEAELGLKEVKEATIGKILNYTKQQTENGEEESVLYEFRMGCTLRKWYPGQRSIYKLCFCNETSQMQAVLS